MQFTETFEERDHRMKQPDMVRQSFKMDPNKVVEEQHLRET